MDSIIFQGNVIGMLMYIIPAMLLFFYVINGLEEKLVERKLYLACGIGVVLGTIAEVILFLSGTDLYTDLAYASMILVTPFIVMMFMFIGVNLKTFKDEPAAPHYSAGYGLFFGGAVEFWKLLKTVIVTLFSFDVEIDSSLDSDFSRENPEYAIFILLFLFTKIVKEK